jgi:hypothetical protein
MEKYPKPSLRTYINSIHAIDRLDKPIRGTDLLSIRYAKPDTLPKKMFDYASFTFLAEQRNVNPKGYLANLTMIEAVHRLKHGPIVLPIPNEPESLVDLSEGLDIDNPDKSWCLRQAAIEFAFEAAKHKIKNDPRILTALTAVLHDSELADFVAKDLLIVANLQKTYPEIKHMKGKEIWDIVLQETSFYDEDDIE